MAENIPIDWDAATDYVMDQVSTANEVLIDLAGNPDDTDKLSIGGYRVWGGFADRPPRLEFGAQRIPDYPNCEPSKVADAMVIIAETCNLRAFVPSQPPEAEYRSYQLRPDYRTEFPKD